MGKTTKQTVLTAAAVLGFALAPLVPASAAPLAPVATNSATVSVSAPNIALPMTTCITRTKCYRGRVTVLRYSKSPVLAYYGRTADNKPLGPYTKVQPGTSSSKSRDVDLISVPTDYWNRGYRIYYQYGYSGVVHMSAGRNVVLTDFTHLVVYVAKKG